MSATLFPQSEPAAEFSPDRLFRYALRRSVGPEDGRAVWIMLNPSTADETEDDKTVRRCIGFTRSWGLGALSVVNLYALRSTDPRKLWAVEDPVGPGNDLAIEREVLRPDTKYVIAAWGAGAELERAIRVKRLVQQSQTLWCLGRTKDGSPRHPLYLPGLSVLRTLS